MELSTRQAGVAAAIVLVVAAVITMGGLSGFGIWDPWELGAADAARHIVEGEASEEPQVAPALGVELVALGFSTFGVHEWSGRLPIAACGLLTVALAILLLWRFAGPRAGVYAGIVAATSPLFVLNARQMIGQAPGFLGTTLVFLGAASLAFLPSRRALRADAEARDRARELAMTPLWLGVTLLGVRLATAASGFMVGVVPALAAVGAVVIARGEWRNWRVDRVGVARRALIALTAIGATLFVAAQVAANHEGYSWVIGGAPRGGTPPSYETVIERVFHSFAPWSAILPLAIGRMLGAGPERAPGEERDEPALEAESALRLALVLWAAFGFVAESIFLARFGTATFLPLVALAGCVALFLRDLERSGSSSWAAGLVTLLLALLVLRDYRGYPHVPAAGLAIDTLTAPEIFNPSRYWAIACLSFGVLALLGLTVARGDQQQGIRADVLLSYWPRAQLWSNGVRTTVGVLLIGVPVRLFRDQWARGKAFRRWMVFFALLGAAVTWYGVLCLALRDSLPRFEMIYVTAVAGPLGLIGLIAAWIYTRANEIERRPALSDFPLAVRSLAILVLAVWYGLNLLAYRVSLGPRSPESRERVAHTYRWPAVALAGLAIASAVLANEMLSSLAVRVGMVLAVLPLALVIAIAIGRGALFGFAAMREGANAPMLVAGLGFGVYTAFGFLPALSSHFSPREVYDTYNALAQDGEPLGEYRVGGRAAAYYATGEVREIADQAAALDFLIDAETRTWLAFRADDLAQLNRAYRQRTGRHLYLADARSARVVLATSAPIEGRADENYIAEAVLDEAPAVQHPVGADFDRRIELIGYDLDLPNGSTVGPGQLFTVTWYWRCRAPVPGGYQIFLHVDGMGQRLNGDHEPVDGRYPVRLWDEGDIIVDRQEMRVPANFPPGQYTFNIGFYAGESRLEVVAGREDDANRAIAGTLTVR